MMKQYNNFGFTPSNYQVAIWDKIENDTCSLTISAVAGSGKSTTIVCALKLIKKGRDVIFLAFNKSIVKELSEKVPAGVAVSTLHSFGCKMLFANYGKLRISENKVFNIGCKLFDRWKVQDVENKYSYVGRVAKLVDFMRYNLVPNDVDAISEMADKYGIPMFGEEANHAIELLAASNKIATEEIDFADMIYLPATRNIKIRKFHDVFIDEAQDLNRAQQEMIRKMIQIKNGRLIAVGDPMQSIYAFAGADFESYSRIKTIMPNTVELPLSVCYRCSPAIVKHAQEIVPHIEFNPLLPEGEAPKDGSVNDITEKSFVLCRNTKPLVVLFIQLLKRGLKANIKGREIGKSIINIIDKTQQKTIIGLRKHLKVQEVKLKGKLKKKGVSNFDEHPQMISYREKVEIIDILSGKFTTVNQLTQYIDRIFLDEDVPGVMLSTVHKSKGLEADRVFILCSELMPSAYAKTEEALQQEYNLMYVARTRAKKELIYIRDFQDDANEKALEAVIS